MAGKFMSLFAKQRSALAAGTDALDEIRSTLAAKQVEAEAVRNAPQPLGEIMSAFDQWMDQQAASALDRVALDYLVHPSDRSPGLTLPLPTMPGESAPNATVGMQTLLGLLIISGRERLRAVVEDQVADLLRGKATFTAEARAARLAQIEDEITDLCLQEEGVLRALEGSGADVMRRRDAPAFALLAADSSLPG